MNGILVKALIALVPAWPAASWFGRRVFSTRRTVWSLLQLLGGCLMVVVFTHICEALHLFCEALHLFPWISASTRLDEHSEFGTFVSTRIAGLVRHGPRSSRVSYGTGFFAGLSARTFCPFPREFSSFRHS